MYTPGNRLELNAKIAATLALPFLMILNAKSDSAGDVLNRLLICKSTIEEQHAKIIGVVLNQVGILCWYLYLYLIFIAWNARLPNLIKAAGQKLLHSVPQAT